MLKILVSLYLFWYCWRLDPVVPWHRYFILFYWCICTCLGATGSSTSLVFADRREVFLWLYILRPMPARSPDYPTIVTKICLAEPQVLFPFSSPISLLGAGWLEHFQVNCGLYRRIVTAVAAYWRVGSLLKLLVYVTVCSPISLDCCLSAIGCLCLSTLTFKMLIWLMPCVEGTDTTEVTKWS